MQKWFVNKMIMRTLGVSTKELANQMGVTRATVSSYINGKHTSKLLQRCVDLELDLYINDCTNQKIKDFCEELKTKRDD